jgi:hypothetical protein
MIIFNQILHNYTKLLKSKLHYCIGFAIIVLFSIILFSSNNSRRSIGRFLTNLHPSSTANDFICPLRGDKWIVVTTIFYPTPAIYKFLTLTTPWNLIGVLHEKTILRTAERIELSSGS